MCDLPWVIIVLIKIDAMEITSTNWSIDTKVKGAKFTLVKQSNCEI